MRTIVISSLFIVSGILGFICQMLYANYFGSGKEMDIYFSLLSIPAIITGATGTIFSSLFFPAFARKDQIELDEYIYTIKTYVSRLALVVAVGGFAITYFNLRTIIDADAPSFYDLALILSTLFWFNSYISIVNGYLASVQNYFKNFLIVSFTQLLVYIFIIVFVILFHAQMGVKSIAFGMLTASIISFSVNRYYGNFFHSSNKKAEVDTLGLLTNICLIIVSFLPFHAFASIAYLWAGQLAFVGGVALLGYSHSFGGFLSTAASMGIATVSFPDLARNLASSDNKTIYKGLVSFREQLEVVVVFASFVAVFTSFFVQPILEILFMRGQFTEDSVQSLSRVLPYYFIDGVFISIMNIARNVFYSLEKQKVFAVISGIVTLSFLCCPIIISDKTDYVGVGIVETLAMACFAFLSLIYIHSYMSIFTIRYIFVIFAQIGILLIVAFVSLYIYKFTLALQINSLISLFVAGIAYIVIVDIMLSKVFKSPVFCAVNEKIALFLEH